MIRAIIITFSLFLLSNFSQAQSDEKEAKKSFLVLDFSLARAFSENRKVHMSLSSTQLYPVALKKKFSIGYGLRFSYFSADDLNYFSAPPRLAGDPDKEARWTLSQSDVYFLNLEIHLHYQLTARWELGFNIDAFGLSGGKSNTALMFMPDGSPLAVPESGRPTRYNALLIGNNDIGSLNSNSYIAYKVSPKWGLLLSYSHIYTEYTLNRKIPENFDNDRFRNKSWLTRLALRHYF